MWYYIQSERGVCIVNIYYKFKLIGDNWFILFENNGKKDFIYNDREALIEYFNSNKDCIFVSGDNYFKDNYMLASIIKNGNPNDDIDYDEMQNLLPVSFDVTQEIVRSNPVKLDTCLMNLNRRAFNYKISDSLNLKELEKVYEELDYKVNFIKELYAYREDYFKWRLDLIKEFNLPIKFVTHSKGRLMEDIVSFNGAKKNGITIDTNLYSIISKDNEMINLLNRLVNVKTESKTLNFGDLSVNIGNQGLLGGRDNYVDTTGENNYLYIDFNSFGPSIIVNNKLLDGIAEYPERYAMLMDRRIELKSKKELSQKYYKRLINSFIDCFNIEESLGYNPDVYKSIVINGVLVMYYLYKQIENLGIEVVEVNTDGMIIKCPENVNDEIRNIVNNLCKKLNMSCDVDKITKIAHRNVQNYCIEYEDGSVKKIGYFGKMENETLQTNSKKYLGVCLLNYYLNNEHNIMDKLKEILSSNDLTNFQEIIQRSSNSSPLFIFRDNEWIELTGNANKFVVVKDESKTPVFKKNDKGELVPYNTKFNFELIEDNFSNFDINRIDLDYYFKQVLSKVEATSGKKFAIFDIDGTLVEDQDDKVIIKESLKKMKIKLDDNDLEKFADKVHFSYLKFMSKCKSRKGYGSVENFAEFCKDECLSVLGETFDYNLFSKVYFSVAEKMAKKEINVYDGIEEGIKELRCQGYRIAIYTNGILKVQKAKLQHVPMCGKIIYIGALDNSYAKSTIKGVSDFANTIKADLKQDEIVMIGNGSSDIFPKTLNIPSYILLNGKDAKWLPKTIKNRAEKDDGVIIASDVRDVSKKLRKKPIVIK